MAIDDAICILDPETMREALSFQNGIEAFTRIKETCLLACDALRALGDSRSFHARDGKIYYNITHIFYNSKFPMEKKMRSFVTMVREIQKKE